MALALKKVRDYLISTKKFDPAHIHSLLHARMKPNEKELLEPIEGYSFTNEQILRIQIISEIGVDMAQFPNATNLCSWAGFAPSSNESGGKKKSVRISRAGVYLKPTLVQSAHAAEKEKDTNPYYHKKYVRISKRRGKKRTIIAIARMMLTAIYHMLSTGETWSPTDLYKIDKPDNLVQRQKEQAIKQATKFLITEGLLLDDFIKKEPPEVC